ncbi:hypothetical protein [Ferirhizobium litorale]|uniref:Uncharacterized protein n=1 Tax=Ferirhizobium litorale TaxID=2927786 RepID=A0AAE3QJZ0_9HYPH|nr:hypothetical protein [Fererhizobium litorale]MDI7924589.1 hypothetical protein [Fererhizobium litorale]
MTTPSNAPAGAAAVADVVATAVATATPGGSHADGYKAASERLGAIMSADGIKGDGKRMAAALELAQQSPGMTAEAITAFVTTNVAASAATTPAPQGGQASGYEQQRLAAANLAQPSPAGADASKAGIDRNAIFAARRAAV